MVTPHWFSPTCSLTKLFPSGLANPLTGKLVLWSTCTLVNLFPGQLVTWLTCSLANFFTSQLVHCSLFNLFPVQLILWPTCTLVNLFPGQPVLCWTQGTSWNLKKSCTSWPRATANTLLMPLYYGGTRKSWSPGILYTSMNYWLSFWPRVSQAVL